jgi:hypothetical protein
LRLLREKSELCSMGWNKFALLSFLERQRRKTQKMVLNFITLQNLSQLTHKNIGIFSNANIDYIFGGHSVDSILNN